MKLNIIPICLSIVLLNGCKGNAQDKQFEVKTALLKEISNGKKISTLEYDTLYLKNYTIVAPKLISSEFSQIIKEDYQASLDSNYCNEKGDVSITYNVKQISKSFISIVKLYYIDCSSMASYSISSDGLNYFIHNGTNYKIDLLPNIEVLGRIKNLVEKSVDAECIDEGNLNKDLDLFFENGKMYINNPLHSKVCDEALILDGEWENLKISKIGIIDR